MDDQVLMVMKTQGLRASMTVCPEMKPGWRVARDRSSRSKVFAFPWSPGITSRSTISIVTGICFSRSGLAGRPWC